MVLYHSPEQTALQTSVEVSAKLTALRFLYKLYSPTPERPCFFTCIMIAGIES